MSLFRFSCGAGGCPIGAKGRRGGLRPINQNCARNLPKVATNANSLNSSGSARSSTAEKCRRGKGRSTVKVWAT
ncbi:Hypothetical protein NTJ_01691 [Nesidiocoris tenuis]|uniref:Uncharacterized protein n=1 Tax=Nesidiocoris tenuis TaxID=355587 RepID=A0ABN7A995_9HEMI|nr:Hypothetical protein NTJ_01691 [Nesidiocoris tenuis]